MKNNKDIIKFAVPLVIALGFIGIMIYAKSNGIFDSMASVEAFQKYMKGFGEKAYIPFFFIQLAASVIAPIPNNITAAAGASILGMWQSFFISMLATIIGSTIAFTLAKKFGKPFTDKFVNNKISSKYGQLIESKGERLLALMFLLPFFPDDAICFLAGLSKISFEKFFKIMVLTRPWGILFGAAVGAAKISLQWWAWIIIVIVTIIVFKYGSKFEEKIISVFQSVFQN